MRLPPRRKPRHATAPRQLQLALCNLCSTSSRQHISTRRYALGVVGRAGRFQEESTPAWGAWLPKAVSIVASVGATLAAKCTALGTGPITRCAVCRPPSKSTCGGGQWHAWRRHMMRRASAPPGVVLMSSKPKFAGNKRPHAHERVVQSWGAKERWPKSVARKSTTTKRTNARTHAYMHSWWMVPCFDRPMG